jgi:uncharacterized protein YggE
VKAIVTLTILLACNAGAAQNISVTGDAEIRVVPDQVVISLGVEVHAKSLSEARLENEKRVRSVLSAAEGLKVQKGDLQTDFIQLGMAYTSDGITPQYYYARKSIVIELHDIDRMEEVLAATVDAGATHIFGVEFETTKLRQFRDQARAIAVAAAADKARDMAAAAGLKVVGGPTGIQSAQYGGRSWYGNWWGGGGSHTMAAQNVMVDPVGAGGAPGATVALGRISVTAAVSMQFRIE